MVYTKRSEDKVSWALDPLCNEYGALGDITYSAFQWSDADFVEACRDEELIALYKNLKKKCDSFAETERKDSVENMGLTLDDINNDGFLDAIVATNFGYQRFFLNKPTMASNEFISFQLLGDGTEVNRYGIGATLHLSSAIETGEKQVQFREIAR